MFIGTTQGILAFFVEANRLRRPYYFLLAMCVGVLFLVLCRGWNPQRIYYIGFSVLILYVALTNAFISTDKPSVLVICVLFVFPLFVPDKSTRIALAEFLFGVFYLVLVVPNKPAYMVPDEISNVVLAVVSSLFIGEVMRSIQLQNFELKRQAYVRERTDPLTGLPNRRQLFEDIPTVEQDSNREALGVFVLDIDFFKNYNDSYGHRQGDVCLQQIGDCLLRFAKERSTTLYRFGGEEFVGILRGFDDAGTHSVCDDINSTIAGLAIPHKKGIEEFVTVSIGYTTTPPGTTISYERLFSQADTALYAAKNQGRNCVRRYSSDMDSPEPHSRCLAIRTRDR